MPHKTMNTTPHLDDKITKKQKEKLDMCENHIVRLKEKGEKM